MPLIDIIKTFCQRTGIPAPASVAGSVDAQVIQLLALANEVCEDLSDRGSWEDLTRQALFTTVNAESQGSIYTIADGGFRSIINESIFNRTLRLPIFGPMSPEQWQALKALPQTGPFYKYRLRQDQVLFDPIPPAGQICAFEYRSTWIVASGAGVPKEYFSEDADIFALPDRLLLAGLRWKWKSEKGLAYAEEFRRYEDLVNNALGRDGSKPRISMDQVTNDFRPGIWVSSGNWNLP